MTGKWDIRRIYLYLVSFATLMMMIVGTVQFLQGIVNISYPQPGPTYSEIEMKYSPNDNVKKPTPEELKERATAERAQQRYYEIRSMINNLILFLVALPVYLYHWRKIQTSEQAIL